MIDRPVGVATGGPDPFRRPPFRSAALDGFNQHRGKFGRESADKVPVYINSKDFVGKRTALFGMTRTGKSNTVKIIIQATVEISAKALRKLRHPTRSEKLRSFLEGANDLTYHAQRLIAGDLTGAATNFKKALELDGKSAAATLGMGEIALRQGLFGDAIAHLSKAAKLSPRNAKVFTLLGEAYLSAGNNAQAAANFKKALQLDPDNPRARDGYNEASSRVPPPTDDEP